jgi:hypothetical protein
MLRPSCQRTADTDNCLKVAAPIPTAAVVAVVTRHLHSDRYCDYDLSS